MVVAVAQREGMLEDLGDEGARPRVVRGAVVRRERLAEEELEDRLPREVELAAQQRRVEGRVEPGVRQRGDRRGGLGARRESHEPALPRRSREARREILGAEVLHELVAPAVVGDERGTRTAPARWSRAATQRRRESPSSRRIGDADDAAAVRQPEAEVSSPPDVADERLDFERRRKRAARELGESGGVGRKQKS